MESQNSLGEYFFDLKPQQHQVVTIAPPKKHLEFEKSNFIDIAFSFIDNVNFPNDQYEGRPRFNPKNLLKSLLIMAYNGMSYQRIESDLRELKEKGFISEIPKRSTMNKYMLEEETKKTIRKLIEMTSLPFVDSEDTLILDSTWFSPRMYTGGYRKVYDKRSGTLTKVRKVHISCLKNSRIICCAKATKGTDNDSPVLKELVSTPINNGFKIKTLLADAGYSGKENYAFCNHLNIRNIFINFKKNATRRRAKSQVWRNQLILFKERPDEWKETYRFRVIVEGIFSSMKRKNLNYLRSRKDISQDIELLLKCLVHNFTIIGKELIND